MTAARPLFQLLLLIVLAQTSHAQIINGDFSNGTIGDCNAGSDWRTGANPNEAEVSCHFDDVTDLCIDLTPCHSFGNGTWVEQDVATIPGEWYRLEIDLATLCGWDGSDAGVLVYIDGQRLCHRVFNGTFTCIPDSLNWQHRSSDLFYATTYLTTIRLSGFSYCSGLNSTCPEGTVGFPGFIGLDNVRLVSVPMPEGRRRDTAISLCAAQVLYSRPFAQQWDTYTWSTGATADSIAIDSAGTYSVIITDSCRVTVSDTIIYHVLACDTVPVDTVASVDTISILAVPTAFSPNGDHINDTFRIRYRGTLSLVFFHIYNRWGQQVFGTGDIDQGWDGSYQGQPQPQGVYQYYLTCYDRPGTALSRSGTLTLIR